MATKITKPAYHGAHSAGIFADKTVDGPEIGTLVAVFDRAKNLPNRKTMGKQDPYCAARLGKEAKKTETDKRGGQTPRWDQELRFTVRDSNDYYKLKVSCFSEDKKTDLIGETWIDLKDVIVPGGGQSDLWHGLQFKGKYAGDIRIELTYYDTRPKDESVVEKRREVAGRETNGSPSNSLSGPRQLKQIKRRPLPADPTGSSPLRPGMPEQVHSSPLPTTSRPHEMNAQRRDYASFNMSQTSTPPHSRHPSNQPPYDSPLDTYDDMVPGSLEEFSQPHQQMDYHYNEEEAYPDTQHFDRHSYGPDQFGRPYDELQDPYQTPLREDRRYSAEPSFPPQPQQHISPTPLNTGSSPDYPHPRSAPGSGGRQYQPYSNRYSTSPLKNDVFRDSPLRQSISQDEHRYMQPSVEDEDDSPPPPPPAHRNGLGHSDPQPFNETHQVPVPAPLNISPGRRSPHPFTDPVSAGALSMSTFDSPSDYSRSSFPTNSSYSQRNNSQDLLTRSTFNDSYSTMPPSLTAGFDPTVAESESERLAYNHHENRQNSGGPPRPLPGQYQSDTGNRPSQTQPPFTKSPSPIASSKPEIAHRGSAPLVRPTAVSPDSRGVPPRKSVSPHPTPPQQPHDPPERRLSGIPFSPDSYDTLNPNAVSAVVIQQSPYFKNPDDAREAARQKEVENRRAVGPIIGNDGREIDPSDHLPADTWAPEPERKTPKKPEVVLRFKNTGNRPQPNPVSTRSPLQALEGRGLEGRAAARPHSIASVPVYAHGHANSQPAQRSSFRADESFSPFDIGTTSPPALNITPNSAPRQGRNRLQKTNQNAGPPPPPQPQHPHSSPSIPTLYQQPRNSPSEYPLRENENYNPSNTPTHRQLPNRYSNPGSQYSSPISPPHNYSTNRNSPYGPSNGPPIPAKIPIQAGSQNYPYGGDNSLDALSRELRGIDIGSTAPRAAAGARRGGQYRGFREV